MAEENVGGIKFTVDADHSSVDKTTESMKRMEKQADKLDSSAKSTGKSISETAKQFDKYGNELTEADKANGRFIDSQGKMREKTGQFVKGMKEAAIAAGTYSEEVKRSSKSTGDLGVNLPTIAKGVGGVAAAAGIAATALVTMTAAVADQVRETDNWAKALGITTGELQALQAAAKTAGVDADAMGDILKDLNEKIGIAFNEGAGEGAEALAMLGLEVEKIIDLPVDEKLKIIGDALQNIEGQAAKSAIGEMLGNDFTLLLPLLEDGNAGLEEMIAKAYESGVALSDFDNTALIEVSEAFKEVSRNAEGTKNLLSAELAPLIILVQEKIGSMVDAFKAEEIEQFVKIGVDAIGVLLDVVKGLEIYLKSIGVAWTAIASFATGAMADSADAVAKLINLALTPLRETIGTIAEAWGIVAEAVSKVTVGEVSAKFKSASDALKQFSTEAKEFRVTSDDIRNANTAVNQSLDEQIASLKELANSPAYSDKFKQRLKEIRKEIEEQAKAEKKKREESNKVSEAAKKQAKETEKLAKEQKEAEKAAKKLADEQQRLAEKNATAAEKIKDLLDPLREIERAFAKAKDLFEQGLLTKDELEAYKVKLDEMAEEAKKKGEDAGKSFSEAFADELKSASLSIGVSIAQGDAGGIVSGLSGAVQSAVSTGIADGVSGSVSKSLGDVFSKEVSSSLGDIAGGVLGGLGGGLIGAGISSLVGAFDSEPTKFSAKFKVFDEALLNTANLAETVAAVGLDQAAEQYSVSAKEIQQALKNNEGFAEWQNGLKSFNATALGVAGFVNEGTERLQRAGQGAADWVEGVSAVIGANLDVVAGFAKTEGQLDDMRKALRGMAIETGNAAEIIEFGIVDQSLAALEAAAIEIPERFREMDAESLAPALFEAQQAAQLLASSGGTLGNSFDALGTSALMLADNAIVAAGGINRLAQLEQGYYQDFFSDTERLWREQVKLNEAFEELGVETPETTAQFRALVEAQDKNTEAGLNMYIQLLELAGAFQSATANAAALASAAGSVSSGSGAASSVADVRDYGADIAGAEDQYRQLNSELFDLIEVRDDALQDLLDQPEILSELGIDATTVDGLNDVLNGYIDELDGTAGVYDAFNDKVTDWLAENGDVASGETIAAIENFGERLVDGLTGITDIDQQKAAVDAAVEEILEARDKVEDLATNVTPVNTEEIEKNSTAINDNSQILSQENSLLKEFNILGAKLADITSDEALATESASNLHEILKDTIYDENIEIFNAVEARRAEIEALEAESEAREAAIDAAEEARDKVEDAFSIVEDSINHSIDKINDKYDDQISALRDAEQAESDRTSALRESTEQSIRDISDLRSLLSRGMDAVRSQTGAARAARAASARASIASALQSANAGILPASADLAAAIENLSDINSDQFESATEMEYQQAVTANQLKELDNIAGSQLSIEEKTLQAIEDGEIKRQEDSEDQIAILEQQRDAEIKSLESLLQQQQSLAGLSPDILTVNESIKSLQSALSAELKAVSDAVSTGAVIDWYSLQTDGDGNTAVAVPGNTSVVDSEMFSSYTSGDYTAGPSGLNSGTTNSIAISSMGQQELNMLDTGINPAELYRPSVTIDVSSIVNSLSSIAETMTAGFDEMINNQRDIQESVVDAFTGSGFRVSVQQ